MATMLPALYVGVLTPVAPLGMQRFGQSGDIPDLYRTYRLDSESILDAAATALAGSPV